MTSVNRACHLVAYPARNNGDLAGRILGKAHLLFKLLWFPEIIVVEKRYPITSRREDTGLPRRQAVRGADHRDVHAQAFEESRQLSRRKRRVVENNNHLSDIRGGPLSRHRSDRRDKFVWARTHCRDHYIDGCQVDYLPSEVRSAPLKSSSPATLATE
ncbi:hypothetical protein GCM10025738_26760 [Microbacterium fluvii]